MSVPNPLINQSGILRESMSIRSLLALPIAAFLVMGLPVFVSDVSAAVGQNDISYTVTDETVLIETSNMTVLINRAYPAAMIRHAGNETAPGLGYLFASILGYNATEDGMLVLEDVAYHAPLDRTAWTLIGPALEDEDDGGKRVVVGLTAMVDMYHKLFVGGGGNPEPGSPSTETLTGWARVTVEFTVSTHNHFSTFEEIVDAPEYPVNGTSELKFDIEIESIKTIAVDRLALDIAVMEMNWSDFGNPTNDPYMLNGYQADEVISIDPTVNETVDGEPVMHMFQHRSQFKQMFSFVEENQTGFFAWASQACLNWSDVCELGNVTTYYRTDGDALRVYISTVIDEGLASITHDPSIGLFPTGGGVVDLPDITIVGKSVISLGVGLIVGAAVAGGVAFFVLARRPADEDPVDLVVLEKNRYYRGK